MSIPTVRSKGRMRSLFYILNQVNWLLPSSSALGMGGLANARIFRTARQSRVAPPPHAEPVEAWVDDESMCSDGFRLPILRRTQDEDRAAFAL